MEPTLKYRNKEKNTVETGFNKIKSKSPVAINEGKRQKFDETNIILMESVKNKIPKKIRISS